MKTFDQLAKAVLEAKEEVTVKTEGLSPSERGEHLQLFTGPYFREALQRYNMLCEKDAQGFEQKFGTWKELLVHFSFKHRKSAKSPVLGIDYWDSLTALRESVSLLRLFSQWETDAGVSPKLYSGGIATKDTDANVLRVLKARGAVVAIQDIAAAVGRDPKTVRRVVKRLEDANLAEWLLRQGVRITAVGEKYLNEHPHAGIDPKQIPRR